MNSAKLFPGTQARIGRRNIRAIVGIWLLASLLFHDASATLAATSAVAATGAASTTSAQAPRKWASSLPSAAPKRHVTTTLSYDELANHIGERVLITTVYGDLRDVSVESYSEQELLVRVMVIGGYATQHIQRSQIRSIRDPD
jgi:hypothetical protein